MSQNYGLFSAKSTEKFPLPIPQAVRINCRMENDLQTQTTKLRITTALAVIGASAREASIRAGMNPDTLGKFLSGKTLSLRASNLSSLARVLLVTESWLLGTTDDPGSGMSEDPPVGIRYGGIVEAGTFRRVNIYNQDAEYQLIPIQPNPSYPADKQFAYRIEGDSMNLEHIMPGMWVHAVEVNVWERFHGAPSDGELVIVEAKRDGNEERELTVKMLRIFRDRIELHPRSSNPDHQIYSIPYRPPNDYDDKVHVIAVVLSSTWLHRYKGP